MPFTWSRAQPSAHLHARIGPVLCLFVFGSVCFEHVDFLIARLLGAHARAGNISVPGVRPATLAEGCGAV